MSQQILVLGCYEHTLTIVRSLAQAGYEVILGVTEEDLERGVVHVSRFVSSTWLHPDVVDDAKNFDRAFLAYLQQNPQLRTVFPVGENSVRELASIRADIPSDVLIAMPDNDVIQTCLNKPSAYQLADKCGIPIPGTRTVRSSAELLAAVNELGLPIIAKPLDSTKLLLNKKCVFIRTKSELEALVQSWPGNEDEYVVQNEITGIRHNCDVVAESGEIKLYFEGEVLRTDRLDYAGNSVFDRSIPPNPSHRKYCEQFIRELNYTGLALIQFLRDPDTGKTVFLEANPRAGAGISLATQCGVDFPAAAVRACAGNSPEYDESYPINRSRASLHDDLLGLRKALVYREVGLNQSLAWLGKAFVGALRADYYATFVWNDMKPTMKIYWNLLTRIFFKDKRGSVTRTQKSS